MQFLRYFISTVIWGLVCLFFPSPVNAEDISLETTSKTIDILDSFEHRFEAMDSMVFDNVPGSYHQSLYDTTFIDFSPTERIAAVDRAIDAEISAMKSRTGLDIRGQIYARPGSSVNYDPDDPLVAYNAKAQAELAWDIFNSSLYKRSWKTRELQIKGELRHLDYVDNDLTDKILLLKQKLRVLYYGQLLTVINEHLENVKLLMETQMYLLEHGKISGDEMLKLINEQSELERKLISIKADSIIEALPATVSVSYITLADTAGMMASINNCSVALKRLNLRNELIESQIHNTDYLQTMNIMPFVRFAYYNRDNVHNTHNLDAGLTFKIPLTSETKKKRNALRAEQNVVKYEHEMLSAETVKSISLTFHDLEIYNESILGEYRRIENLRKFLALRKESYYKVDGEYSRIGRLIEYNAYLQAWERLLDFTYKRDCLVIDLQKHLLNEPITNYIKFNQLY